MFLRLDRFPADLAVPVLFRLHTLHLATLRLRKVVHGDLALNRAVESEGTPLGWDRQAAAFARKRLCAHL
ncbi:hypothetical protein GCM10010319_67950 [Streptomyces blastmyceticus]|uniref:Uncharacterized protein n=1 Tax=Streptomyces blastmyceticus TaxID=68180 RepID=A0ABN0Y1A8_9ACTN